MQERDNSLPEDTAPSTRIPTGLWPVYVPRHQELGIDPRSGITGVPVVGDATMASSHTGQSVGATVSGALAKAWLAPLATSGNASAPAPRAAAPTAPANPKQEDTSNEPF
jgi:hypothetical protein